MTPLFEPFDRYTRALHPLDTPPSARAWNLDELIDLLPDGVDGLRPAAVLVGLVDRGDGLQVLLTRRTEALRHHAGQISFPGGRIEGHDADPVAAALREAHEEIGLAPGQARALGYLDPFVTITGFHVFPVVAVIESAFTARRDPGEVDEVFELPLEFLMDPANARQLLVEYRGGQRTLIEFVHQQYRVWGATAAMLVNLRHRLEQSP
ncbi:MAG: CoA pyrophosphatase [Gammaproteobacteria bacterium]|nr:CoA pyrophosphatase [Gammaproteobacteria bacterium]